MSMRAPLIWELATDVPAQTGVTTTQSAVLGEVSDSGTVTEVAIVPAAAVTANTNNFRTFTVMNRGTAGTGTTVVATLDTSTTGFTSMDERLMTLGTAANLILVGDSVLAVFETVASSGVAHGGYKITAKVSRT